MRRNQNDFLGNLNFIKFFIFNLIFFKVARSAVLFPSILVNREFKKMRNSDVTSPLVVLPLYISIDRYIYMIPEGNRTENGVCFQKEVFTEN